MTSLVAFFLLAYGLTWPLAFLVERSILFGLLGLFGPALAALLAARLEGRAGTQDLLARTMRWRVPTAAYLLAFTIPFAVSVVVAAVAKLLTPAAALGLQPINGLSLVLFVLVAGEEIGWRGFALPRLLQRLSPWSASLVLGVLWGFWHLPLFFIPGTPQSQMPLLAFILYTIGLSFVLTWFFARTGGSALLATIFHGATNTFGLVAGGVSTATRFWIAGVAWVAAGAILLLFGNPARNPARAPATGG